MKAAVPAEFYDIESLSNVFSLCNFREHDDTADVYLLDDSGYGNISDPNVRDYIASVIRQRNKKFKGPIRFYDLHTIEGSLHLINALGADDSDPFTRNSADTNTFKNITNYKPFIQDTDPGYSETDYPYVMGYNSYEYDDTMLALFHSECWTRYNEDGPLMFTPPTAKMMREYNNLLFTAQYKKAMSSFLRQDEHYRAENIKKHMCFSGRHIDVSKLNEKQSHLALKRICGMLGYQILESDKLDSNKDFIASLEELAELLAYNISDCISLAKVFHNKAYYNPFMLKRGLLKTYPELIYQQKRKTDENGRLVFGADGKPELLYQPDIDPARVARNRLYIDSSSQKFASRSLCPYGELDDIAAVSFLYPAKGKSLEENVPRANVLEEARLFFYSKFPQPEVRAEFDRVYAYYKSLEGRNFNEADNYNELYNRPGAWNDPSKTRVQREYYEYLEDYSICIREFNHDLNALIAHGAWKSPKSGISYMPSAFMDMDKWKFDRIIADYNLAVKTFQNPQNMFAHGMWTSPLSGRVYQPSDFSRNMLWKHPNEMYYPIPTIYKVSDLPKVNTNMPYFKQDGKPSSCYVTFSIGGIHGAEYNIALFEHDRDEFNTLETDLALVKQDFPNPCDLKRAKEWTSPISNIRYTAGTFLKSGATLKKAEWKDIEKKRPLLFKKKKDAWAINPKYVYTSSALSNHEDFTSYYPNLLIQLMAFWNEKLGYDRYNEIFGNKEKYGKLMKDKSIPQADRDNYSVLREGTKLILNSASGAGDASFYNPIRMNNNIISMRLIGQLFTWRIGQAQTYEGAIVISTNTDGLYTVMEKTINAEILERESKDIHVAIEPELCYLISKDSNNRMEENEKHEVISASGGSLACRQGPNAVKSLAHPAILDWALCEYMRNADGIHSSENFMFEDFDEAVAYKLFEKAKNEFTPAEYLRMFQNVIASSPGTVTYNFGVDCNGGTKIMQHYNRIFIVKPDTKFTTTYHLAAVAARAVPPATKAKRLKQNERLIQHDPLALSLLQSYGVPESEIPDEREAVTKKITNLEYNDFTIIENRAYEDMSDVEITMIIDALLIPAYVKLLKKSFANWRNIVPGVDITRTDEDETEANDEVINILTPQDAEPTDDEKMLAQMAYGPH